uniref:Uncharacterized protein n=1 Tax=Ciona intestinalis TaxID=7719 RepID=H2XTR3_CIOIN
RKCLTAPSDDLWNVLLNEPCSAYSSSSFSFIPLSNTSLYKQSYSHPCNTNKPISRFCRLLCT